MKDLNGLPVTPTRLAMTRLVNKGVFTYDESAARYMRGNEQVNGHEQRTLSELYRKNWIGRTGSGRVTLTRDGRALLSEYGS